MSIAPKFRPVAAKPPRNFVGLDFETYSSVDIKTQGLDNYVNSPTFKPLIASVSESVSHRTTFDFVRHPLVETARFRAYVNAQIELGCWFSAHNAGFERAVLQWMGFPDSVQYRVTCSAVVARWAGAHGSLANAAPQLTRIKKLETGDALIKVFSVPTEENGGKPYTWEEIQADVKLRDQWNEFIEYCEVDAQGSRAIVALYHDRPSWKREHEMDWYTFEMNRTGWNVDVQLVNEMQLRYEHNSAQLISDFYTKYNITNDKFLNSTPQMVEWCKAHGVKTTSFDAEHLDKLLLAVQSKIATMQELDPKLPDYQAVEDLLVTKRELGGSSLKKLQTILNLTGGDGRLRNQYLHAGAGQTYRSTGKGVQLQNLKRLSAEPLDFDDADNDAVMGADNTTMAENLRQVFYADEPDGRQIVGDFSSVEARGLAWVAGDDVKIKAFKDGKDLYKVQAMLMYPGLAYDDVTKAQRQVGKVGELGCGYGAGPEALVRFAAKMGVAMTEGEGLELVRGWRSTNEKVTELWDALHSALETAVRSNISVTVMLAHELELVFDPFDAPDSLRDQHPGVRSIRMSLYSNGGKQFVLERVFHGVYLRSGDICFYKPSQLKSGLNWVSNYKDPKTGKVIFFKLYGGKITGILIQSLCRELFFDAVRSTFSIFHPVANVNIIGQFHDELVVSWTPQPQHGARDGQVLSLDAAESLLKVAMENLRPTFNGFPLAADIKNDYRYTK